MGGRQALAGGRGEGGVSEQGSWHGRALTGGGGAGSAFLVIASVGPGRNHMIPGSVHIDAGSLVGVPRKIIDVVFASSLADRQGEGLASGRERTGVAEVVAG